MTEAELQKAVIDLAHLLGWRVAHFRPARTKDGWRTPVAADGKGFPDLVMAHPDVDGALFVELKSARGTLTHEQKEWLVLLDDIGEWVDVWTPEQWIDGTIEKVLKGDA
jgi:hypothetical protein